MKTVKSHSGRARACSWRVDEKIGLVTDLPMTVRLVVRNIVRREVEKELFNQHAANRVAMKRAKQ